MWNLKLKFSTLKFKRFKFGGEVLMFLLLLWKSQVSFTKLSWMTHVTQMDRAMKSSQCLSP